MPPVWYKIEMVVAGVKTENLLFFAGREDSPAGTLTACQVVKLKPVDTH
jgi:hypothetical protein